MMDPSIDNKEQNRRQQNEPEEEDEQVRVDSSSSSTTTTTVIDQLTSHLASTHINNNHNDVSRSSSSSSIHSIHSIHSSSSSEQSNDDKDNIDNFKHRIQRFAQRILNGQIKRMLLITGAGLSTAAGIPDFRTPGTGLYYNLQKYNLPTPTSIFELSYFMKNPEPFFLLSQDFLDIENRYEPTDAHYFIRLLHDKGLLLRNYTQNIDGLEFLTQCTSIDAQQEETSSTAAAASSSSFDDVILQCHGSYRTAHCVQCNHLYTNQQVKQMMNMNNNNNSSSNSSSRRSSRKENVVVVVPYCTHCNKKNNIIKPDIVMFGESLPDKFERYLKRDVEEADCVLIMGTSLTVYPVAGIPELIINKHNKKKKHKKNSSKNDDDNDDTVEENARVMTHMLFNRERVGPFDPLMSTLLYDGCGVSRSSSRRRMNRARDSVQHEFMFVGEPYSIDDAVNMLVDELGWREEFNAHRSPTSHHQQQQEEQH